MATLVDTVVRTRARPAIRMPPVGEWRDPHAGASLRATNHNTTRSNRYPVSAGPTDESMDDLVGMLRVIPRPGLVVMVVIFRCKMLAVRGL